MADFKFFNAVLNGELPISKTWLDDGWPELLYPWFLACTQLPEASKNERRAFTYGMGQDIEAGKLPSVMQRIPWFIEDEIIEPHVNAQDFAAWLASKKMEPSPLTAEWITKNSPSPAPATTQEPPAPEPDPSDQPKELDIANIAFRAVSNGYGNQEDTFKNRLIAYLESTYPKLLNSEIQRIATIANPDKERGAPKKRNRQGI